MGQSMMFISSSPMFTIRYDQFMFVCTALFPCLTMGPVVVPIEIKGVYILIIILKESILVSGQFLNGSTTQCGQHFWVENQTNGF